MKAKIWVCLETEDDGENYEDRGMPVSGPSGEVTEEEVSMLLQRMEEHQDEIRAALAWLFDLDEEKIKAHEAPPNLGAFDGPGGLIDGLLASGFGPDQIIVFDDGEEAA